jgi:hypothetical protein
MVDVVNSFLNNAVDLYVQAVNYCQISTSQIPTPVGAGIRRCPVDVAGFRGYHESGRYLAGAARSSAVSLDPARTPDNQPSGRDPGWIQPEWPDPRHLARSDCSG